MVVACLALFVASTGTSIAASHYLITSTKQIKPSVIKALKGAKGPRGQSVTGLTGAQGPKGDTGATGAAGAAGAAGAQGAAGAAGAQGPSGVVTTARIVAWISASITTPTADYAFVHDSSHGMVATVTTTASQRITGTVAASLGSSTSTSAFFYDLCYQQSTGGALSAFDSPNGVMIGTLSPDPQTFVASSSVVPGAGTWIVDFCVLKGGSGAFDNNKRENGWVQVTN
jgi:hypothetical protein